MIRSHWKQKDMTANPEKYPQKGFKDKSCKRCAKLFSPKAPSHLYCSDVCKDDGLADNYYKNNYGISLDEVRKMLDQQNGKCFICQEIGFKMKGTVKSGLNVDHCHSTGQVRGLLCHNCNRALGLLKDNKDRLKRAISYLEGATTIP